MNDNILEEYYQKSVGALNNCKMIDDSKKNYEEKKIFQKSRAGLVGVWTRARNESFDACIFGANCMT